MLEMHAEAGGAVRVMRDRTAWRRRLAASDLDAQGDGMAMVRRTAVWWWLSVVGALCVLLLAYAIMWYHLPKWAPEWVRDHSPFIEPFVRAIAEAQPFPTSEEPTGDGFPGELKVFALSTEEEERLLAWGAGAIPVLEGCLDDRDPSIRYHAFRLLGQFGRPSATLTQQMLKDPEPAMRLLAWWRLAGEARGGRKRVEVTEDVVVDAAFDLLQDPEGYVRADAGSYLAWERFDDTGRLLWDRRERLYECMRGSPGADFCAGILFTMLEARFSDEEPFPSEVLFPLLALANDPMAAKHYYARESLLPRVQVDYASAYEALSAMQRGDRPWEPGAEPWMHEQMQRLYERRVAVPSVAMGLADLIQACFPDGNVVVDQHLRTGGMVVLETAGKTTSPMAVLLELQRRLKAQLHLCYGVTALETEFGFGSRLSDGFIARRIPRAPGVDSSHPAIRTWSLALKARRSVTCAEQSLLQWCIDESRRLGVPIEVKESKLVARDPGSARWLTEIRLQDLPLEQILCFAAYSTQLCMEWRETGLYLGCE